MSNDEKPAHRIETLPNGSRRITFPDGRVVVLPKPVPPVVVVPDRVRRSER